MLMERKAWEGLGLVPSSAHGLGTGFRGKRFGKFKVYTYMRQFCACRLLDRRKAAQTVSYAGYTSLLGRPQQSRILIRLPNLLIPCFSRLHASVATSVPSTEGGGNPQHRESELKAISTTKSNLHASAAVEIESKDIDNRTQRQRDIAIIRQLLPNVWPKGDSSAKTRVVIALSLLIAGKLMNIQVPFFFKNIVDSLNIPIAELSAQQTTWTIAGSAIVGCMSYLYSAQKSLN